MKTIEAIEVIKMKKKFCALLVLALVLCWCLSAFAAARMPENRGALTDDANVLGTATAKDVTAYAERVEEETGVKWEDLPEDFTCELCGVGKDQFSPEE